MKSFKELAHDLVTKVDEDAPANAAGGGAIAGLGVDHPDYPGSGEPGKKKKKMSLIDGRTKAYREHRKKLEVAREKREGARLNKEGSWSESVIHKMSRNNEDS